MKYKMLVVFFLAFLVRTIALDQSLWLDEATTAVSVESHSLASLFTQFLRYDFHPPLYYLFMKLWTALFGSSEVALRLPSVLFSLLAGYMVFRIGKHVKNASTGLWASALFLFNPLIVYYSQEARMYMMVTFFLTAALYFFIRLQEKVKRLDVRDIVLFNLFCFLSLGTFYGSVFIIFSMLVYAFLNQRRLFFLLLPGNILALLLLSPLLFVQLQNAASVVSSVSNWRQVLGPASIKNAVLIPLKFSTGRISMEPKIIFFAVSGIWTIVTVFYTFLGGVRSRVLLFVLLGTLLTGFLFSFVTPVLQYFRFVYLVSCMALLIAFSAGPVARAMMVTGFLIYTLLYLFLPQFHREDWRSLVHNLPLKTPLYMILPSADPVRYYLGKRAGRNPLKEVRDLAVIASPDDTLVVIPYTTDIYGFDYALELRRKGYEKASAVSARGLQYEVWQRTIPPFKEVNVEFL